MKRLFKAAALGLMMVFIGLAAPIGYVELICRPRGAPIAYAPILPPQDRRAEGNSLLTYPEWHIVHAYDDYARVIADGDPHDFRFLSAIAGFWSSLCSLSGASGPYGGFPAAFKSTVYTIGVSFTAEMLLKAVYEESLGRLAVWLRGDIRAASDDLTAGQAAAYAKFLQQVPWYRWDFAADAQALAGLHPAGLRDRERQIALGLEYAAKARYAKLIAAAVANMEPDALRLRMIVRAISARDLAALDGVNVIAQRPEGTEVETPRYRALTTLLAVMAQNGGEFVEIAGNDDILATFLSAKAKLDGPLHSFPRQGYGDTRHLIVLPVRDLAEFLRQSPQKGLILEHIHDY